MTGYMKVLLISPQPFFRVRGTPLNIRNVATALGQAGHEVDILCYPFGEDLDIPGVRILRSPRFPGIHDVKVGPSPAKFPLDGLMALHAAWKILFSCYDVVHAVEESVFFVSGLTKLRGMSLIYDMDSLISDQLAYSGFVKMKSLLKIVTWMERRAIRKSDRVLTVCQSLSYSARALVPEAMICQIEDAPLEESFVPDEEGAARLRDQFNLGDRPCVVYTGNFEGYQGLGLLVDSMAELRKTIPDAVAVLVGGEERHRLGMMDRVRQLDLADQVVFTGPLPLDQMPACLTLASVLAAPRIKGTNTALKVYGYMQTGKPVVATRLETHTQVLDDDSAWLTELTATSFAEGLHQALTHPDSASKAEQAKKRVDERYSLARFNRQVQELYAGLDKEKRPSGKPAGV
jgi:glycosyltransferase involved in cell wall biosynthesis